MGIQKLLKQEILKNDNGNLLKALFFLKVEPKREALFTYRLAKEWYDKGKRIRSKYLQNKLITKFGCDISMKANIGEGLHLRHVNGVVIGKGVEIGKNVIIYHQVTIGGKNIGDAEKNAYPQIKDNVTIFSGAKIIGDITIGENAVIGANSVVITNVESNSVYAGVPAKKVAELPHGKEKVESSGMKNERTT